MALKWESNTTVVQNDFSEKNHSNTESLDEKKETSVVVPVTNVQQVKEPSLVPVTEKSNRLRQYYSPSELNHSTLFVVGSSEVDQLPLSCCDKVKKEGTNEFQSLYECSLPTPVFTLPKMKIVGVSCGALHTAFLTSTGVVYTFGCNDVGALGRKPNSDASLGPLDSEPTAVNLKQPIKKVTCGDNHTLYLTFNGVVYFSGSFKDNDGPIGVADYNSYETLNRLEYVTEPVRVPLYGEGSTVVSDVCSGENHCVLLCQGGNSMYTFGSNEFYQLLIWEDEQVQNPTENDVDLSVKDNKKLLLTWPQHRRLVDMLSTGTPRKSEQSEQTDGLTSRTRGNKRGRTNEEMINQVFTGNCTTFFQTKSLRLYGAGRNAQGEVGVGKDDMAVSTPKELLFFRGVELSYLSGGQFFTMALVNDYVFVWGQLNYLGLSNDYKEDTTESNEVDYEVDDEFSKSLRSHDSDEFVEKRRKLDEPGFELDNLDALERLFSLDYDRKYKAAVKLGKSTTPVLVQLKEPVNTVFHGPDTLFALTKSGELYSWGSAQNYVLGNGKDYFYQQTPQLVPPENFSGCKVVQGAGGSQHTVFMTTKKREYNTGYKRY